MRTRKLRRTQTGKICFQLEGWISTETPPGDPVSIGHGLFSVRAH